MQFPLMESFEASTFLDVPGAGVVAIWSWTYGGDSVDLGLVRNFVAGLRFG